MSEDFDSPVFCDRENANIQLIRVYEDILDGVRPSSDNPYIPYYNRNYEYIFYDSSNRLLSESDVIYPSDMQADMPYIELYRKMYNEIGRILTTLSLQDGYSFI